MSLGIDLSAMPAGVIEEFRRGRVGREVMTLQRAPRLQDLAARGVPLEHKATAGLGRVRMVITADAFHYWGRRLGYECWQDKQFLHEFERDNPAVRGPKLVSRARITVPDKPYEPGPALKARFPEKGYLLAAGKYARVTVSGVAKTAGGAPTLTPGAGVLPR